MGPVTIRFRIELRDLPRVKAFVWELRQIEQRLRIGAHPEAEVLEHSLDRFLADMTADESEPTSDEATP